MSGREEKVGVGDGWREVPDELSGDTACSLILANRRDRNQAGPEPTSVSS